MARYTQFTRHFQAFEYAAHMHHAINYRCRSQSSLEKRPRCWKSPDGWSLPKAFAARLFKARGTQHNGTQVKGGSGSRRMRRGMRVQVRFVVAKAHSIFGRLKIGRADHWVSLGQGVGRPRSFAAAAISCRAFYRDSLIEPHNACKVKASRGLIVCTCPGVLLIHSGLSAWRREVDSGLVPCSGEWVVPGLRSAAHPPTHGKNPARVITMSGNLRNLGSLGGAR